MNKNEISNHLSNCKRHVNLQLNEKDIASLLIIRSLYYDANHKNINTIENLYFELLTARLKKSTTIQHYYRNRMLRTLPDEKLIIGFSIIECFLVKNIITTIIDNFNEYEKEFSNRKVRKEYLSAIIRLSEKLSKSTKGIRSLENKLSKIENDSFDILENYFKEYCTKAIKTCKRDLDVNQKLIDMNIPDKYKLLMKYLNETIGSDNQSPIELLKDMHHITLDNNAYGFEVSAFERIPRNGSDLNNSVIAIFYNNTENSQPDEIMFKRKVEIGYEDTTLEDFIETYNNSVLKEKSIIGKDTLMTIKDDYPSSKGYSYVKGRLLRESDIFSILKKADFDNNETILEILEEMHNISKKINNNIWSKEKDLRTKHQDIYDIAIKYINRTLCSVNQSIHNLMQDTINVMYDNGGYCAAIILDWGLDTESYVGITKKDDVYEISDIEYRRRDKKTEKYVSISNNTFKKRYSKAKSIHISIGIPDNKHFLYEESTDFFDGFLIKTPDTMCSAYCRGVFAFNTYYCKDTSEYKTGKLYQGYDIGVLDKLIEYMDLRIPIINI
ncbi:hypothetical protein ACSW8S_16175 (plasmid) [Clostridium perfringens]